MKAREFIKRVGRAGAAMRYARNRTAHQITLPPRVEIIEMPAKKPPHVTHSRPRIQRPPSFLQHPNERASQSNPLALAALAAASSFLAYWFYSSAGDFSLATKVTQSSSPNTLLSVEQLENAGIGSGRQGRHAPRKVFYGQDGAYLKEENPDSVRREVVVSRIIASITSTVFDKEIAPKSQIVVSDQTLSARAANRLYRFFHSSTPSLPSFASLYLLSPCIGDGRNLSQILELPVAEHDQEKVEGFGVALALANLFTNDANTGNFIVTAKEPGTFTAYPIDWELPSTTAAILYPLTSQEDPRELARTLLEKGWLKETKKPDLCARALTHLSAEIDQLPGSKSEKLPLTQDQIERVIDMMQHDIAAGKIEAAYQALAEMTPAKISALVSDQITNGTISQEDVASITHNIMVKIEQVRKHLKQHAIEDHTNMAPTLSA